MTKIALVSPYSWTYPGGVTRHIEALAQQLLATGHDVRVLAPWDPDDAIARGTHGGAVPQVRSSPDYLVALGRTVGISSNGAVSNLSVSPLATRAMRRELATGGYDVVHIHEPVAPLLGWDACHTTRVPRVGTFHCFSENVLSNNAGNLIGARRVLNHLNVRIAVSEAAAWTGRRFYGGHYRIVPNGVEVLDDLPDFSSEEDHLRIVFVGQAVERKGLPVLLRAFEALREHVPATLKIIGATQEEVEPLLLDDRGVEVLGKISDQEKNHALREADVLCAPSLGGESFGMVLTEAFASGTPVIASDIAGYRDVLRDGREGVLVPRGDATALAEALRDLWYEPARRATLAAGARARAERFAWPRIANEVLEAYDDAQAVCEPEGRMHKLAMATGIRSADPSPNQRRQKLPSLEPALVGSHGPLAVAARRIGLLVAVLVGAGLTALALDQIGIDNIVNALVDSSPTWVLVALGLMCASMLVRAVAWRAILQAALPKTKVSPTDAMQGTFIGVLMSATLPARLGEPSRALIVARRLGRPREILPVVLGTLVSQTILNIVALAILGSVMFATVGLFQGHEGALVAATVIPIALIAAVLAIPTLLRRGKPSRYARVAAALTQARSALEKVRDGLLVFRNPRKGAIATIAQLSAWALQWLSCYLLLVALGLEHQAGMGAAAAVLFAVNVTAVLPITPSNLGIFQAACVAVLSGAYGISSADALGYGIILQAVEIATAVIMGVPALVREGVSWRDVRLRAMHTAPVSLRPRESRPKGSEVEF